MNAPRISNNELFRLIQRYGAATGCCEHGNDPSGLTTAGEYLLQLSKRQVLTVCFMDLYGHSVAINLTQRRRISDSRRRRTHCVVT